VSCAPAQKTAVIDAVEAAGARVEDFHTREASLEDLFLAYTEGETPGSAPDASATAAGSPEVRE
jgi:ABC-2 type transport system ATP-binding protein